MRRKYGSRNWREPLRVWLIVLGTMFATETALMVALPWILPTSTPRLLEAAVDAFLLTLVLAPVLWRLLLRPLREANQLRAEFLADLFTSMEADRRQTAHDLHDGVGQSLTLLVSGLKTASVATGIEDIHRHCADLKILASQALLDVKRLALGLRPSLLDDLGLAPALERVCTDVRENHPIQVTFDVDAIAESRLPSSIETALFRITQEALANVIHHSKAKSVSVIVRREEATVIMEVQDDGVGIPPSMLQNRNPGHLGLTGMRERATLLGGGLSINTQPDRGTRVTVRLPLLLEQS
ncbi:hypothetical protein BH11PLA2_BH11PLA2_18940 [soil metagenome]